MFRYRALDANGDMQFGRGVGNFFIDDAQATAQSVKTRLALWTNEWFLNLNDGTPWASVVGQKNAKATADLIVQQRILGTFGVTGISGWWSGLDPVTRLYVAGAVVDTLWGAFALSLAGTPGGTFDVGTSPLDGDDPLG